MFGIPSDAVPVVALAAVVLATLILAGFYTSKVAAFIGVAVLLLTFLAIKEANLGHDQLLLTVVLVGLGGMVGLYCGLTLRYLRGGHGRSK